MNIQTQNKIIESLQKRVEHLDRQNMLIRDLNNTYLKELRNLNKAMARANRHIQKLKGIISSKKEIK